jgi:hypothetical protein
MLCSANDIKSSMKYKIKLHKSNFVSNETTAILKCCYVHHDILLLIPNIRTNCTCMVNFSKRVPLHYAMEFKFQVI